MNEYRMLHKTLLCAILKRGGIPGTEYLICSRPNWYSAQGIQVADPHLLRENYP